MSASKCGNFSSAAAPQNSICKLTNCVWIDLAYCISLETCKPNSLHGGKNVLICMYQARVILPSKGPQILELLAGTNGR